MKKIINIHLIALLLVALTISSCKKEYGNLNSPTVEDFLENATKDQLNNLVSGTESAMRNNLGLYLDDIGAVGREMYRFSGADPRYVTDLLGGGASTLSSSGFYITNVWSSRYRVVKNCNVLEEAAANSTLISDAEKKGYQGFAKTIKAYQLLLILNLTDKNGIRIDVADPNQLGPIVGKTEALTSIAAILDEARTDLSGATISFPLSAGFSGFTDAAGLIKFNRALAARVAIYRKEWAAALTAVNESFFAPLGDFSTGVYNVFGTGTGDQLNPAFFPQNQAGEVRLAHPTYTSEIEAGDDRINKASLRTSPATSSGLTSDHDVWVYTSSTAPVPIIRNEELLLIFAEANIQLGGAGLTDAVTALNRIRTEHNLLPYAGAVTQSALITEMLEQRRYSLFFEGHRWIDMRRYDLLSTLPIDRTDDDVWSEFPLPNTEQ
ncbi:RagB/SusD family nutrient uptake outer membrane protein [Flavihumibacter fluvii]|uniref:RagB/SusD family nutrient uptake outer membrane protein n=1 Tax=Flavihumibacter fluvii TaxID=2838157 RepID=UPI001BDEC4C4|nr:RagB/SusD family nutrient uptake outer membrane protein [Flavihumibacter fluvii]ULQ54249.1 RagB/SusD family nutrient uptake outer membrane protein [Flavihumibacter fluvii]